jgi:hypothetical protein
MIGKLQFTKIKKAQKKSSSIASRLDTELSDKWWKETKRLNESGCCMAFIKLHQD